MPTERLFDELTASGATYFDLMNGVRKPVGQSMRDSIKGCVRVVADDAWDWYWSAEEDFWSLYGGDFGPMRMPFDGMWIEGGMPRRCHADGKWFDMPTGTRSAVLMKDNPPSANSPQGCASTITASYLRSDAGRTPVAWPIGVMVHLDDQGACIGVETVGFGGITDENEGGMANAIWGEIKSGFLAISLMNCRNTKIALTTPVAPPRKKKSSRPRPAKLEFHTITLPGAAAGTTSSRKGAAGEPIAFHKVRGHFAHYTADAPLFGKYTGTYWKPWHARGTKAAGIIVADYKVGR